MWKIALCCGVVALTFIGCADAPGLDCGIGTHEAGDVCVPDEAALTCGAGTHASGGMCVPDDATLTCGPGTHASGSMCVPDDAPLTCGAGTHASGGMCVPDDGGLVCGPGTHADGTTCVPDASPLTCGPGTHVEGSVCAPDVPLPPSQFQIRIVTNQIPADGFSKIPVLAIGTAADGSPALVQVVLNMSRAGAGSFQPPAPTLGPLGATSYFVPCNAATPGCVGPLTLTLALASAPSTPVATVDVVLVAPTGVGSPAPCQVGGNVMFFDGNDFIYNGVLTVTNGSWSVTGNADHLALDITPAGAGQGLWWNLDFDASDLPIDLTPGVYNMAERYPFQSPDHPGLSISGDGRGCNTLTGRFQVHAYDRSATAVTRALVTFEQHCEGGALVLRGCVAYNP